MPTTTTELKAPPKLSVYEVAARYRKAFVRNAAASPPSQLESQETNVDLPRNLFGELLPVPRPKPVPREKSDRGTALWWEGRKSSYRGIQYCWSPISQDETEFRHGRENPKRDCVTAAYKRLNFSVVKQNNYENCGTNCVIEKSPSTGRLRVSASYCKHRFCVACGTTRSRLIAKNLLEHLNNRESRFITLTLKHRNEELRPQIKRLLLHFRNLRQSQLWKEHVTGGVAFVEVKRSKNGKHWHPHLHVICEGIYLAADRLSAQWLATTGDSKIIDITYVTDANKVARYVVKYASKPLDITLFDNNDWLDEAIQSLHGIRLCNTFGKWRGVELEAKPEDPGDWQTVCTLNVLKDGVRSEEAWAIALLKELTNREDDGLPLQSDTS